MSDRFSHDEIYRADLHFPVELFVRMLNSSAMLASSFRAPDLLKVGVSPVSLLEAQSESLSLPEWLAYQLLRLARNRNPQFKKKETVKAPASNSQTISVQALETVLLEAGSEWTDFERYQCAEVLSAAIYPKYKFSEFGRIFLEDEEFRAYYKRHMDSGNWHSYDRKYCVKELLRLVTHLPGDFVECGVYKGATSELMCKAARPLGKTVHLFDSFQGLSDPGNLDGSYWKGGRFVATVDEVRHNLAPLDCYKIYDGWIPSRFSEISEVKVSFLHIDVDLYEPTRATVEFFYNRMVAGGLIICDDYGTASCPGAKKAIDDFFADKVEKVASLPTGQSLTIKSGPP